MPSLQLLSAASNALQLSRLQDAAFLVLCRTHPCAHYGFQVYESKAGCGNSQRWRCQHPLKYSAK
jgi:hypothetical protein